MVTPGRLELPTRSLGNCCSIHLSYGATSDNHLFIILYGIPVSASEASTCRVISLSSRTHPGLLNLTKINTGTGYELANCCPVMLWPYIEQKVATTDLLVILLSV